MLKCKETLLAQPDGISAWSRRPDGACWSEWLVGTVWVQPCSRGESIMQCITTTLMKSLWRWPYSCSHTLACQQLFVRNQLLWTTSYFVVLRFPKTVCEWPGDAFCMAIKMVLALDQTLFWVTWCGMLFLHLVKIFQKNQHILCWQIYTTIQNIMNGTLTHILWITNLHIYML